jgi:hypothetical protein
MHSYNMYEWGIRWMYEGEYLCRGTECMQVKDVDCVLDTSNDQWNVGALSVWENGVNVMEWV